MCMNDLLSLWEFHGSVSSVGDIPFSSLRNLGMEIITLGTQHDAGTNIMSDVHIDTSR